MFSTRRLCLTFVCTEIALANSVWASYHIASVYCVIMLPSHHGHTYTLTHGSFEAWGATLKMEETTVEITNKATICEEGFELPINYEWFVSAKEVAQRTTVSSAWEGQQLHKWQRNNAIPWPCILLFFSWKVLFESGISLSRTMCMQ